MPNFDERITARVVRVGDIDVSGPADVVVACGVNNAQALRQVRTSVSPRALLCAGCSDEASALAFVDAFEASDADSLRTKLARRLVPWGRAATGSRLHSQAVRLFGRGSSEDTLYAVFFVLHRYVLDLAVVRCDINPSWEKGIVQNVREFAKMARCCGPQILRAVTDPVSKKAVDMLNTLDLRDQVGSYRVIVSFETPLLEEFSLCVLQQNNCFGCDAPILDRPRVPLLQRWRGERPNAKAARQIMIGHLDHPCAHPEASRRHPWSWRIVCGANPAYDAFPAQHQIFYPSEKAPATLWYDPVFKVETVDGRQIWTKRHYRCTPREVTDDLRLDDGSSHGAWTLTTVDNGIMSLEHWTTVDAADDLSWAVLHYTGAATRVGQSYQGALLCSADGKWPQAFATGKGRARIEAAFRACGLQMWELYGHGPPDAPSGATSFMWTEAHERWAEATPPPLEPIGDMSVSTWRQQQRALAAQK